MNLKRISLYSVKIYLSIPLTVMELFSLLHADMKSVAKANASALTEALVDRLVKICFNLSVIYTKIDEGSKSVFTFPVKFLRV